MIEVIGVRSIGGLPKKYIPFDGNIEQAQAALLKDRELEPSKRKYPVVDRIYHFTSDLLKWWYIVAIPVEVIDG